MNILAIDFGTKIFGIAISFFGIPMPYKNINHLSNEDTIRKIKEIILEEKINLIVLGIPLNEKGKDTERSLQVKDFFQYLKKEVNIEIILIDEKFTTKETLFSLKEKGIKNKSISKTKDSISAMNILKRYLEK